MGRFKGPNPKTKVSKRRKPCSGSFLTAQCSTPSRRRHLSSFSLRLRLLLLNPEPARPLPQNRTPFVKSRSRTNAAPPAQVRTQRLPPPTFSSPAPPCYAQGIGFEDLDCLLVWGFTADWIAYWFGQQQIKCSLLLDREREMGSASKELLKLEHNNAFSSLESSLLVCPNGSASEKKNSHPREKPITAPIPKSQVLGKVRDFLGVISEANEKLQLDAKENSGNYDIEALTGNESQIIEMDLMLGIADLHTPEAVAAAESAITGCQSVIPLAVSSSGTESEDSSDDNSDYNESDDSEKPPMKLKRSNSVNHNSVKENVRDKKSKKRSKIVELS